MTLDPSISLDMLKVTFKSKAEPTMQLIQKFWDKHLNQGEQWAGEHWISSKHSDYAHVWTFPSGDSVVSLMYGHNSQNGKEKKSGAIEWNPNKVNLATDQGTWSLIRDLLRLASTYELSKADVAYDLPGVAIHQCTMDMLLKADCRFYMGRTGSMTIYSGARGSAGSCKVYDKRKEVLDRGGQDIGIMTRYELTFKANITFLHIGHGEFEYHGGIRPCSVPELVVMNQPELGQEIDFEDHLLIAGLQQLPHLYCMMSKYKKKRIKELQCCNTFAPSISEADELLISWFRNFHKSILA